MNSVIARQGDTFDAIARRVYGDDRKAALLRSSNPGAVEPFEAGAVITTPTASQPPSGTPATNETEVALTLSGKAFRYWEAITITRTIDSMDTLALRAPFDPEDSAFRSTFRPFAFTDAEVTVGGAPLFKGVMLSPEPEAKASRRSVIASCYSSPAVIGDCTAPASDYPLQWDESKLSTIAEALAAPFGLSVVFDADEGAIFERVALKTSEKILPFLIKLAQQRGLLVSSTERGELLFTKAAEESTPVARLTEGASPLLDVVPMFDPQSYYSEITGVEPTIVGLRGGQLTVKNERLVGVVRPFVFEVSDTINADLQAACDAKTGRMFANAVMYSVTLATWLDSSGALWAPNTYVTLTAPGAMVYTEYAFLIRSVILSKSAEGEKATLTLVLPGAFSGQIPETLPWD